MKVGADAADLLALGLAHQEVKHGREDLLLAASHKVVGSLNVQKDGWEGRGIEEMENENELSPAPSLCSGLRHTHGDKKVVGLDGAARGEAQELEGGDHGVGEDAANARHAEVAERKAAVERRVPRDLRFVHQVLGLDDLKSDALQRLERLVDGAQVGDAVASLFEGRRG